MIRALACELTLILISIGVVAWMHVIWEVGKIILSQYT